MDKNHSVKQNILDTTITLFIEKGVENVATRDVTLRMGLSRSHIYHYFPNWKTLCLAAYTYFLTKELTEFSAKLSLYPTVEHLDRFVLEYMPETPDTSWQLYSSLWRQAIHDESYAELVAELMELWNKLLADIIQTGINQGYFQPVDTQRATRQLLALLNGYSDDLIVDTTENTRNNAIEDIRDFITRMIIL